jgi:Glycosyl hydrolases family 16
MLMAVRAILALVLLTAGLTGPFSLDGQTWCPSYQAQYGCTSTQAPSQYSVKFSGSQTTLNGSTLDLAIDSANHVTGAFNNDTYSSEYINDDMEVWANINAPCDAAGNIENWPAFWLDGTVGPWPEHGEIDIAEGLIESGSTHMWWHYWYYDPATKKKGDVGGEYAGSDCGPHWYTVSRTASSIKFYKDSVLQGTVTDSDLDGGAKLATDPMYTVFDYAAGKWGGPTTNGAVMRVSGIGTYEY